jgi:serine/threonine-protein kinase
MADVATRVDDPGRRVSGRKTGTGGGMRRCPTCGNQYPADFKVCPKDTTPLEQVDGGDDDPLIGEVLAGSFCITGFLGAGGMGRVYEADHVRLPRRFAVKVMHESLALNSEAISRFEREAQAVARIENDHVVDVVDVIRARDGRPCIVTELLHGEELGDLIDRTGKLPLENAITICRQVCRGLAAAHAAGVVHRDLKPSNLFLAKRPDGAIHVKILDFGVAKMTDGSDLTRTGMVVGTPAYMAPEQARGSANVDERADVYAVGAVLYRLVTGFPPFTDDDPALTLTRLLTEDPPRPRDLVRTIPEGLELLIQRAMSRSPVDRPTSVTELDRQLAAFDEPRFADAPRSALPSQLDRVAVGSMETIAVSLSGEVEDAEDVSKRARRMRPAAMMMVAAAGLCFGSAVLAIGSGALRAIAERPSLTSTEVLLLGILSSLAMLVTVVGAIRALALRWRSLPAVERLANGLRAAVVTLLTSVGVLSLAWRGYFTLGEPLDKDLVPYFDVALVLAPTLLAATVFVRTLRKAGVTT